MMTTLVWLLLALQAPAGPRPDFSGQWVVNAGASDFGLIPPPQCRGLKLAHREPELLLEETTPAGEACGLTIRYTTDGVPVSYTTNGTRMTARLTWRGAALVIQRTSPDGVAMQIDTTVSADGRQLTRTFQVESPQGATEWTYVYDLVR